jgi:hypothetical protein
MRRAISPYAPNGAQSILGSGEFYKHFTWPKKKGPPLMAALKAIPRGSVVFM